MPDFASKDYWEDRFTKSSEPHDWLVPAKYLADVAQEVVDKVEIEKPQVLHIGCGTSESYILRKLVKPSNAPDILNVDYSQAAIQASSKSEQEQLSSEHIGKLLEPGAKHDSVQQDTELPPPMRWSQVDLLSLESALSLLDRQRDHGKLFDLVLDKSTSDSISCGVDPRLTLPYPLSINGWTRRILGSGTHQPKNIHPLHVLAVHLAALTTPKTGRWIAVSYSEDRFPFLPPFPATASAGLLGDDVIQAGFPHPHQLWRLEYKEQIDLEEREETLAERKKRLSEGYVCRPKVKHWLYILRRADAFVTD